MDHFGSDGPADWGRSDTRAEAGGSRESREGEEYESG